MAIHPRPKSDCVLIAEIGINHNGDIDVAKQLIEMAKKYDCDYVKFQKRDIDIVYTQEFLNQPRESPWGATQRDQKKGLEFGKEQYEEIDRFCKEVGMGWFASAWDMGSLKFLDQYDCRYQKIASAMLNYLPFLEAVAERGKHTLISTGMSTFQDIDRAVEIFNRRGTPFTLMHCVSTYPCPDSQSNIAVMLTLRDRYKCPVGYSGHEAGTLPTLLAAAMGAEVIERHITLNRAMYGSDQAASLEGRGLEVISKFIRHAEAAFGNGEKVFDDAERAVAKKLRYFEVSS